MAEEIDGEGSRLCRVGGIVSYGFLLTLMTGVLLTPFLATLQAFSGASWSRFEALADAPVSARPYRAGPIGDESTSLGLADLPWPSYGEELLGMVALLAVIVGLRAAGLARSERTRRISASGANPMS